MRDLSSIDFKDSVRFVVRRDLKSLGIKVPKSKAFTKQASQSECNNEGAVFGVPLDKAPSKNVGENFFCSVPKFLVDCADFLRHHLSTEGLFRKSGSVQRQKILKQKIELGEEITNAQAHDVASLLKQFFRQLQEPLLTNTFHDSFIKTLRLENESDRTKAMLYICLMLPLAHLQALQYTMQFIAEVASHAEQSKMGTSNLAIVLTPNLMHNTRKDNSSSSEKLLKDQTMVISTLLRNAKHIGLVPEGVYERAKMIGDEGIDAMTSSGDELDGENIQHKNKRNPRPRTRTASITGFIGKFIANSNSSKTPVRQHRRTKSVKADLMHNKHKYNIEEKIIISKDDTELQKLTSRTQERMSLRIYNKRKLVDQNINALSPANKRRAMMKSNAEGDAGIGHPVIVSTQMSTQMFTTSIKPLTPVKPLANMVKKDHAKLLLSAETEHVKVVDAATYVPSPDTNASHGISTFYAPSPCTGVKSLDSSNDNTSDSPIQVDEKLMKMGERGVAQRKRVPVSRRNSSGATSCFSSSPRRRQPNNAPKAKNSQDVGWRSESTEPNTEEITDQGTPLAEKMDICLSRQSRKGSSHMMYTGPVGAARLGPSSGNRANASDSLTPCKYHVGTPPMPTTVNREFKTVLSQKI